MCTLPHVTAHESPRWYCGKLAAISRRVISRRAVTWQRHNGTHITDAGLGLTVPGQHHPILALAYQREAHPALAPSLHHWVGGSCSASPCHCWLGLFSLLEFPCVAEPRRSSGGMCMVCPRVQKPAQIWSDIRQRKRCQVVAVVHIRGISLDRVSAPVTAPQRHTG